VESTNSRVRQRRSTSEVNAGVLARSKAAAI
jgi:hypothetical protein